VVDINDEAKTICLFSKWFFKMIKLLFFSKNTIIPKSGLLITHGDTITTLWGAVLGKITGCKVMHLESGLRSFNLLQPFPEEITRVLTFRLTDIFVCPNDWSVKNVQKYKKPIINSNFNTQYDSVNLAINSRSWLSSNFPKKYAVVSIHRFENIFDTKKFQLINDIICYISSQIYCIFVLHPATLKQLEKNNLFDTLQKKSNITLLNRLSFFSFVKLINKSQFVVTDGGSNQEELSYLGKPTLILRDVTERVEGLGKNAVLSKFDDVVIKKFLKQYKKYVQKPIRLESSPSKMIVHWILNEYEKN